MKTKEENLTEEKSQILEWVETSEISEFIKKSPLGTFGDLDKITIQEFIFGVVNYVLMSLKRILEPKEYGFLVKTIKVKQLADFAVQRLKFSLEDHLEEKYHIEDVLEKPDSSSYVAKKEDLNLPWQDYLLFVKHVQKGLPNDFRKAEIILRKYHLDQVLVEFSTLLNKLIKKNTSSIWKEAYKIGLLQGKLGLTELTLDPELINKHYRKRSTEAICGRWEKERRIKEQEEKPIIEEARRIAKDRYEKEGARVLHDKMAKNIWGLLRRKNPQLKDRDNLLEVIRRAISPIAKEYGRLRGVRLPEFSGTVVKVNGVAKHIVVKGKEEEKIFWVSKTTKITKDTDEIEFDAIKKGMSVSVKYRAEKGKMVARAINVTTPARLLRKKVEKKPAEDAEK